MPNAYVFLHGGWVCLARCLRNQKKKRKEKKKREDLKKTVEHIAIKYYRKESYKVHFSFYSCYIIKVYLLICIAMIEKKSGVDGFSNMLRNYQSGS